MVGGAETVDYILERCAATGEAYLPEQVHAVIETQLELPARHRRRRGRAAGLDQDPGGNLPPTMTPRPWYKFRYQGKEVVHTMHDQHGTLEVRGR